MTTPQPLTPSSSTESTEFTAPTGSTSIISPIEPVTQKKSPLIAIMAILLILTTTAAAYFYSQSRTNTPQSEADPPWVDTTQFQPIASAIASASADPTVDWQAYSSKDNFFSIQHPSGWYQYSLGGTPDSYVIAFSSQPEDFNIGWRSLSEKDFAFHVGVFPNKQTTYNNGWDMLQLFPQEDRAIGFSHIDQKTTSTIINLSIISGVEAFEIEKIPSRTFEGENFYSREIYLVAQDKIIIVTPFTGKGREVFENHQDIFTQILQTFQFTN